MKPKSILIVDDNSVDMEIVSIACSGLDCKIDTARSAEEALAKYKLQRHTLVLTDYQMEPHNGIDLIQSLKIYDPEVNCLLMSGFADAEANRFTADWELPSIIRKPIRIARLTEQIRLALDKHRGATHRLSDVSLSNEMDLCLPLLGRSPQVCRVRTQVSQLMDQAELILIEGPAGVGKQDLAEFIHRVGQYAQSPLITYSFQNRSLEQIESEIISQEGELGEIVRRAEHATLLLKNIECIPARLQPVLASNFKRISKLCWLIATSDVLLDDLLMEGKMHELLYFELSVDSLKLPSLLERREDIDDILRALIKQADDGTCHAGEGQAGEGHAGESRSEAEIESLIARMLQGARAGSLSELKAQLWELLGLQA